MSWPFRILFVVTLVFLLPALTLGTVSPVVAKLAVDRLKTLQADRHRDRPGLRLGNGRQHPRHLLDRLFPDRHVRHQGGDPACSARPWPSGRPCWARSGTPSGPAFRWASASWRSPRRPLIDAIGKVIPFVKADRVRGDRQAMGHPRGAGRPRSPHQRVRLGR